MTGPEHIIELSHGYTYSARPLACAAALATLALYEEENLFQRVKPLEPTWAEASMGLKGIDQVQDIRTVGLVAGIDLEPSPDGPGKRGFAAMDYAFREAGLMMRTTGDTVALSPPLIVSEDEIDEIVDKVAKTISAIY